MRGIQRAGWILCAGAILCVLMSTPAFAESDRLAALKELKIDTGTITSVERIDAPTLTLSDGRIISNLPPRIVVKMVLNPATGSNIRVELWLPDAEKWNARFLGLGNGGSAGSINPSSFTGPILSGYAVATTDMGTAPNADSGIGNKEVWKDPGRNKL